jgi:hypothetical protein
MASAFASSVAVDAHAVYYTTNDSVMKVDKSGGSPVVVAGALESPGNVTVRGGNVYWVNATTASTSGPNPPYAIMTACK